jgi:hypothetical protein
VDAIYYTVAARAREFAAAPIASHAASVTSMSHWISFVARLHDNLSRVRNSPTSIIGKYLQGSDMKTKVFYLLGLIGLTISCWWTAAFLFGSLASISIVIQTAIFLLAPILLLLAARRPVCPCRDRGI